MIRPMLCSRNILMLSLAAGLLGSPGFAEAQSSIGSDGQSVTITGNPSARSVPDTHRVRDGDTLWDITGHYYGDPYQWPRVWSFNPEISNPHWIYPGGDVRLRLRGPGQPAAQPVSRLSRARHAEGTVWLREQGFIDRDALDRAGVIVGSREEHMLLSREDAVYVRFDEASDARPGREYAIFRPLDPDERVEDHDGRLVRIYGTVRLDDYSAEDEIGRGVITESFDPIERGFFIAPFVRELQVVPPRENHIDLRAEIVATLRGSNMIGAHQVVYINVGENEGLRLGNRFFAVSRDDEWRSGEADVWSARSDDFGATYPDAPVPEGYPAEVVAEGRVVSLRPDTATVLITTSTREVQTGDTLEMRAGF